MRDSCYYPAPSRDNADWEFWLLRARALIFNMSQFYICASRGLEGFVNEDPETPYIIQCLGKKKSRRRLDLGQFFSLCIEISISKLE